MTLSNFDAVLYTVLFLVPGFIWSAVFSMFVPARVRSSQNRLLEFLTLSCINHAIWIWMLVFIFTSLRKDYPGWSALLLVVPTLLSPVALGFLTAWMYKKDWLERALGRFGFRTVHQIPTAWDYHFSRAKPHWVIVRLRDGSRVYGLFHTESFAGDDPGHRDLYLQAVYAPREDGEWVPSEDTAGILIKAEEIAAIEFRNVMEN